MNYQRIHDEIIERAITRNWSRPINVIELHHILPKCMGGTDSRDNIAALTPREHVLIHVLLYKIHRTGQMAYAVTAMYMGSGAQKRPNSRKIAQARIDAARYYSENHSGENHNWFGKKHSEETKEKQRQAALGRTKDPVGVEKTAETKRLKVVATNLLTEESTEFEGMRKAVDAGYATSHSSISKVCKGKQKTHNGYTWKYAGKD